LIFKWHFPKLHANYAGGSHMNHSISKLIRVLAILCVFSSSAFAQRGMFGIRVGYLDPKDTKSGIMVGGQWGTAVDESVDLGLSFDVFHKTYIERSLVAEETVNGTTTKTYETEMEYARTAIPLMLEVNVKIPTSRYRQVGYLITGGLGYEFLWSKENNYQAQIKQSRRFGNFGWLVAAGVFYKVGSRSTFTLQGLYSSFEVSRSIEKSVRGLPVSERVDLSGFGFRVGVLLDLR
jgi:hypothetical protein